MKSAKGERSQAFKKKWPLRLCALVKCKQEFLPKAENQKFHIGECRIRAFWIKREGGEGAVTQEAWEAEIEMKKAQLMALRSQRTG